MVFREVETDTWKPEKEGDMIEGVLLNKQEDVGVNKSMMYHLEVEPGKQIGVWGSAILDDRMISMKPGDRIQITYKGLSEKKAGKKQAKIFKVAKDYPE